MRNLEVWENVPDSYELKFAQLTHAVWTQVNDERIYYAPRTESVTVLCADRDPADIPVKGYSQLLQPRCYVLANSSNHKENQLIQVKLHNECCVERGTCLNLSTMNLNLNLRETISHADDLS